MAQKEVQMQETIKGRVVSPPVLMTHPSGNPAMVPSTLVKDYLGRGFKEGYKEPKEVTERRAASKVNLADENAKLKAELAALKKK